MWNANATKYYFDGKLVGTLSTNVPSEPSYFVWNAVSTLPTIAPHIARNQLMSFSLCAWQWSSGNEKWSAGPPAQNATLRIKKIDINYKTVSVN